jgi:hypothetical protein
MGSTKRAFATMIIAIVAAGGVLADKWHEAFNVSSTEEPLNLLQQTVRASLNHTVRSGDGYGGAGFVVEPIVSDTPTSVVVLHGLGGDGQEVGCKPAHADVFQSLYVLFMHRAGLRLWPCRPLAHCFQSKVSALNGLVLTKFIPFRLNAC